MWVDNGGNCDHCGFSRNVTDFCQCVAGIWKTTSDGRPKMCSILRNVHIGSISLLCVATVIDFFILLLRPMAVHRSLRFCWRSADLFGLAALFLLVLQLLRYLFHTPVGLRYMEQQYDPEKQLCILLFGGALLCARILSLGFVQARSSYVDPGPHHPIFVEGETTLVLASAVNQKLICFPWCTHEDIPDNPCGRHVKHQFVCCICRQCGSIRGCLSSCCIFTCVFGPVLQLVDHPASSCRCFCRLQDAIMFGEGAYSEKTALAVVPSNYPDDHPLKFWGKDKDKINARHGQYRHWKVASSISMGKGEPYPFAMKSTTGDNPSHLFAPAWASEICSSDDEDDDTQSRQIDINMFRTIEQRSAGFARVENELLRQREDLCFELRWMIRIHMDKLSNSLSAKHKALLERIVNEFIGCLGDLRFAD